MSKITKKRKKKARIVYPRNRYEADIKKGVKAYAESVGMVTLTHNINIRLTLELNKLEAAGTVLNQEDVDALVALNKAVAKSIDVLEEIDKEYISNPPAHLPSNSLKVDEWNLNLLGAIMDCTEWTAHMQDVYRGIIERYELSDNVVNEIKQVEATNEQ